MEEIQRPSGVFKVSLQRSQNPQLRSPWVYSVLSPRDSRFQGSAKSERGANRAIRKIIAREEAELLEVQKKQQKKQLVIQELRRCGLEERSAQNLSTSESLRYRKLAPGQVLCSQKSGWRGDRKKWQSQIFLQGREIASSKPHATRYAAERQALRGLQKFYEQEALEEL